MGWPPRGYPHRLGSFAGWHVRLIKRVQIVYAVVAGRLGEYGDAGIQVRVTVGGTPVTVNVLSSAGTCITRSLNKDCPEAFYKHISNVSDNPGGGVEAAVGRWVDR